MSLNNYRSNPEYPDRYTRNKNWRKILPVKGRPIQAAELTEIQSVIQDNVKQGFNTLFRNGTRLKGLKTSVASRDFNTVNISVSDGQIYIEGQIIDVIGTTLSVPTDNVYTIVVQVIEEILTEVEDPSLRDPIKGSFTLGTPGASRLIWRAALLFVQNDEIIPNSYAIAQVVNGVVLQKDLNPFYEVENIISKFIYERSGNFCVNGLQSYDLGISTRSTSNLSKFEELQSSVNEAKADKQESLSNLVSYQSLINSLTSQISEAQIQASLNPTAQNNATLASLQNQYASAQNQFSTFSTELANAQLKLDTLNSSLERSEALITDQQIIGVNPGVAYVEGYRVALNSPTKLYIPKSLPSSSVEAATFTFRGIASQSLRNFLLTSGTTTQQTPEQYIALELDITNIEVNPNTTVRLASNNFNIKVVYKIFEPSTLEDVVNNLHESLTSIGIDNLQVEYSLQNNSTGELITEDLFADPITKRDIKVLLSEYFNINKPSTKSLLFTASNLTLNATSISINIRSRLFAKADNVLLSNITNLGVNINTQTLSKPISNSTYQLGFRPVSRINRLVANLETTVTITRNENSSEDLLGDDSVVRIEEVSQTVGDTTTVFSKVNYSATQSGISWKANATEQPSNGESYQVRFIYTEPLIEDTDFELDRATDTIRFIGRTPALNQTFSVDYTYFLSKAGVITLDKDGIVNYILSNASKNPTIPAVPDSLLPLASFVIYSDRVEITKLECRRQTVADLYDLSEKIRINSLNNEIIRADLNTLNEALSQGNDPIGVYTNTFVDLEKLDLKKTNAAIIPGVQGFTNSYVRSEVNILLESSTSTAKVVKNEIGIDTYACLPFTEEKFFSQPRMTKELPVPRISRTIQKRARMYLSAKTIFLTSETDEVYQGSGIAKINTKLSPCDYITKAGNFFNSVNSTSQHIKNIKSNIKNILGPAAADIIESFQTGIPIVLPNTEDYNNFLVKAFNDIKVRQQQIDVRVEGLPQGMTGFKLYLNGVEWYDYTLRNGTSTSNGVGEGIEGFTVKPDGTIDVSVNLPRRMPTGAQTIEIKRSGAGYAKATFYVYNTLLNHLVLTPLAAWDAYPITTSASETLPFIPADVFSEDLNSIGLDPSLGIEVIDNTVSFQNNIEAAYPTKQFTVNQTFTPSESYFLTRVDLKVRSAPTGADNELVVCLTDTNNRTPIKQIRSITKNPLNYNIVDAQLNSAGVYTSFSFNTPQYIERNKKYNIGLESYTPKEFLESTVFSVYSAVADELDIPSNTIIGEQLFIDGELITSKDGSSLNIQTKEDLTMELYRANFQSEAIVDLGVYSNIGGINFFCLNTRDIIPLGTSVTYEYQITNDTVWVPFNPNMLICLTNKISGFKLRAKLITNFNNLTPLIQVHKASVTLYTTQDYNILISSQVNYPEPYQDVTITIEYIKPDNTDIKIFYSPTSGFEWEGLEWFEVPEVEGSTVLIDPTLQLYKTTYNLREDSLIYTLSEQRTKFRYRIDLESNEGVAPIVRNIQTYVE